MRTVEEKILLFITTAFEFDHNVLMYKKPSDNYNYIQLIFVAKVLHYIESPWLKLLLFELFQAFCESIVLEVFLTR